MGSQAQGEEYFSNAGRGGYNALRAGGRAYRYKQTSEKDQKQFEGVVHVAMRIRYITRGEAATKTQLHHGDAEKNAYFKDSTTKDTKVTTEATEEHSTAKATAKLAADPSACISGQVFR